MFQHLPLYPHLPVRLLGLLVHPPGDLQGRRQVARQSCLDQPFVELCPVTVWVLSFRESSPGSDRPTWSVSVHPSGPTTAKRNGMRSTATRLPGSGTRMLERRRIGLRAKWGTRLQIHRCPNAGSDWSISVNAFQPC